MPKVLISIRLDEETVKLLNKKAKELGVGLTVLIREYIETMIVQEMIGLSKTVHLPIEEYDFLLNNLELKKFEEYINLTAHILSMKYLWLFGKTINSTKKEKLIRELLNMMKIEGKIIDYDVRIIYNKIFIKAMLSSNSFSKVFCKLFNKIIMGSTTECKVSGNTILVIFKGEHS